MFTLTLSILLRILKHRYLSYTKQHRVSNKRTNHWKQFNFFFWQHICRSIETKVACLFPGPSHIQFEIAANRKCKFSIFYLKLHSHFTLNKDTSETVISCDPRCPGVSSLVINNVLVESVNNCKRLLVLRQHFVIAKRTMSYLCITIDTPTL